MHSKNIIKTNYQTATGSPRNLLISSFYLGEEVLVSIKIHLKIKNISRFIKIKNYEIPQC
jgi:hypothetical protein